MLGAIAVVIFFLVAGVGVAERLLPSADPVSAIPGQPQASQQPQQDSVVTGTDQAKSQEALEEQRANQKRFKEGMSEFRRAHGDALQARGKHSEKVDAPGGGERKEEKAPAVASWATDTSTVVTATTCSGTPIELYEGEKRMLDLHNRTRAEHGLSPLCIHPALMNAARDHSQDMIDKDYFAHASRDGSEPSDRMVRAGYAPCGRTYYCGENIAVGPSYPSTPDRLFEGLMNSPGHKANILKEEFREVGIGAHTGSYKEYDGSASMYTVDFGGPP